MRTLKTELPKVLIRHALKIEEATLDNELEDEVVQDIINLFEDWGWAPPHTERVIHDEEDS